MEISAQLLRPFIEKMENEWRDLYTEVSGHVSGEAVAMCPSIQQRIRQLEKFRMSAMYYERDGAVSGEFPSLREALRFIKLDLRTSRRKWRRHLVSKMRTQKRQERASHAASATA